VTPHPTTAQRTVFVLQREDCGRLRSTMRASTCPWPHVTQTVAPRARFWSHPILVTDAQFAVCARISVE
jgi:hypothetical protein